mmetsp:Transcript_115199/g.372315  ORF Transcript_115199/g.372315 Transcript_115199/m.372315 type:complete len:246 (+) Transcript_115199:336-1073(+)
MKPMERPSTNKPLRQPKAIKSSHSSREKAPQERIMSTKETAMQPSTFRIRFARFLVVSCSVANAKSRIGVLLKFFFAYSLISTTRWSGFARDLMRCPMPMMSWFVFFIFSMKSFGLTPLSCASENILAASSSAPPKRGPIVRRPLQRADTKSLPARAVTMVLCAPLTAGPWSAVTMRIISINFVHSFGNCRRNHSSDRTPPMPRSWPKTSEIVTPQYVSSSPRSSEMEEMKFAGLRTMPSFLAQV